VLVAVGGVLDQVLLGELEASSTARRSSLRRFARSASYSGLA
jgi:hypothetical protein